MKPIFLLTLLSMWMLIACNPDDIPRPKGCKGVSRNDALIMEFEYRNYSGQQPEVAINPGMSDDEIFYQGTVPTAVKNGNVVELTFPNIRLGDGKFNYISQCVKVEEFNASRTGNNQWFPQTEFQDQSDFFETKLAVSFCVDLSSSLGEDRELVIKLAKQFADNIIGNSNSGSYISLVLYADTVISYPFTQSLQDIDDAFNNFPAPPLNGVSTSTKLYDGIIAGLDSLVGTNLDVSSKVLVAFTDGNDNGSDNPSIKRQDIQGSPIQRYMIGLKGKGQEYDSKFLSELASSKTQFVQAKNRKQLEKRFKDINQLVANIYTIKYQRSDQELATGEKIRGRVIFYAEPYKL